MNKIKDAIKKIALAVYKSPKVRMAAKALGVAVLVVIAEILGLGASIIELIQGL